MLSIHFTLADRGVLRLFHKGDLTCPDRKKFLKDDYNPVLYPPCATTSLVNFKGNTKH